MSFDWMIRNEQFGEHDLDELDGRFRRNCFKISIYLNSTIIIGSMKTVWQFRFIIWQILKKMPRIFAVIRQITADHNFKIKYSIIKYSAILESISDESRSDDSDISLQRPNRRIVSNWIGADARQQCNVVGTWTEIKEENYFTSEWKSVSITVRVNNIYWSKCSISSFRSVLCQSDLLIQALACV